MTHRLRWPLLGALTIAAVAATSSTATPPGKNGRIAFARFASGERGGDAQGGSIFTIGVDGKGERRVTRPPAGASDTQPDWSPDGSRIVFERQFEDKPFEIWTVKPDGSDLRRIDSGCAPGLPKGQICDQSAPAWSPDGKQIAFSDAFGKLKYIDGVWSGSRSGRSP